MVYLLEYNLFSYFFNITQYLSSLLFMFLSTYFLQIVHDLMKVLSLLFKTK